MESRSSKCRLTTPPNQPRHPISCIARPRSSENYREVVEHWIVPALGNVKLAVLRPEQIAHAYSEALAAAAGIAKGYPPDLWP